MPLQFTTADERMQRAPGIKGVIVGPSGIGKTSLLWTLDPAGTLFVDMEAGDLSVDGWQGTSIDVRKQATDLGLNTWEFMRHLACWIGGPNPAVAASQPYSAAHYQYAIGLIGDPAILERFTTIFFDSITVASRTCFAWCNTQPRAFSEKTGKPDIRGAYGLLGQEMIAFLTQLQHARGKSVWFVGILDKVKDDYGRTEWVPQIEGQGTSRALPGIVDQVISMVEMDFGESGKHRVFVTQTLNEWGYPAKDRSGQLDPVEKPHLGELMEKIRSAGRRRALAYALPEPKAAEAVSPLPPASAAAPSQGMVIDVQTEHAADDPPWKP
ncbi:MAG: hypothetical protein A3E78_12030 [Alphaproteobacteria bacterium RIFCSPHIGHO2_12_FULL_63_12]|nr:MAG: hypothetical protein A3E78_12030 [Alphaproteobacteria bacterium RIFCSPHIGHO2_12_FULL_63_12]